MTELDNLHIDISPITGDIYVGVVSKDGTHWLRKRRVTEMVLTAAARHLLHGDTAAGGAVDVTRDGAVWAQLRCLPIATPAPPVTP